MRTSLREYRFSLLAALLGTTVGGFVGCQTPPPPPPPPAGCATDADCDDDLFCNGEETCSIDANGEGTCVAGTAPCSAEDCVENADFCPECTDDADCDDGQFCNGEETCNAQRECDAGTDPCADGETCDEAGDECVEGNGPPAASAGADQSVEGGASVTLDGSGSSDPDGDTLGFAWTQTAGTAVNINNANTASASFTAPDEDVTLTFELTVTDGNGGEDTDSVNVTVTRATEPRLFIANFGGDGVIHYANPSAVNGNIAPAGNLDGAATLMNDPADIVVNSAGQLLVANFTANTITTYDNAETANGNLAPDGNVSGGATQLVDPVTLAINTAEDLLFVADLNGAGASQILVFAGTSETTFNGNLAPTRTIQSAAFAETLGINFGADDELYVANNSAGADNVLVFANASNLNGNIAPTRILTSGLFGTIFDVFVDGNDTLFVVDSIDGEVYIFNDASSLNGPVTPDFTLDVPPAVTITAIAVDSNDTGYIVDFTAGGTGAVFSYDNISTRNGSFNPDRTIQGAATQLANPIRVFLTE